MAVVFTKSNCRYCAAAKATLAAKQIPIHEIRLDEGTEDERAEIRELFVKTTGATTVPQIFIGSTFVGPNSALEHVIDWSYGDLHPCWGDAQAIRVRYALRDDDF